MSQQRLTDSIVVSIQSIVSVEFDSTLNTTNAIQNRKSEIKFILLYTNNCWIEMFALSLLSALHAHKYIIRFAYLNIHNIFMSCRF